MKNKQHEYILKAYINSRFPRLIYESMPDMVLTFEFIDNLSLKVLKGEKICLPNEPLLTAEEKKKISYYFNVPKIEKEKREELIFFYRLTIIVIDVIEKNQ